MRIARSDWQNENKISLTKNHDFNTCNICAEPKSQQSIRSLQSHQVPERIDSLDNNNPLKIYTKLTSTSAGAGASATTCVTLNAALSAEGRTKKKWSQMVRQYLYYTPVGCSICLYSENASRLVPENCDRLVAMSAQYTTEWNVVRYRADFGKDDNIFQAYSPDGFENNNSKITFISGERWLQRIIYSKINFEKTNILS